MIGYKRLWLSPSTAAGLCEDITAGSVRSGCFSVDCILVLDDTVAIPVLSSEKLKIFVMVHSLQSLKI